MSMRTDEESNVPTFELDNDSLQSAPQDYVARCPSLTPGSFCLSILIRLQDTWTTNLTPETSLRSCDSIADRNLFSAISQLQSRSTDSIWALYTAAQKGYGHACANLGCRFSGARQSLSHQISLLFTKDEALVGVRCTNRLFISAGQRSHLHLQVSCIRSHFRYWSKS